MRKTQQPTGKPNHACPQIISAHVDVINNSVVGLSAEKTLKKKEEKENVEAYKIIPVASSFSKRGNHHFKKLYEVNFNQDVTIPKHPSK